MEKTAKEAGGDWSKRRVRRRNLRRNRTSRGSCRRRMFFVKWQMYRSRSHGRGSKHQGLSFFICRAFLPSACSACQFLLELSLALDGFEGTTTTDHRCERLNQTV